MTQVNFLWPETDTLDPGLVATTQNQKHVLCVPVGTGTQLDARCIFIHIASQGRNRGKVTRVQRISPRRGLLVTECSAFYAVQCYYYFQFGGIRAEANATDTTEG